MYFQSNSFIDIPSSCRGAVNSSVYAEELFDCEDLQTLRQKYITSYCEVSYDKVCTSEYTDNPPFSCSKVSYPTFITTIATAFANASGVWTFVVIFLKLMLKIHYPHGYSDYDYDEERERFIPRGFKVEYPDVVGEVFGHSEKGAAVHPETDIHRKTEEDEYLRQRHLNTSSGQELV